MTGTPSINSKSKRIVERKINELNAKELAQKGSQVISQEVYNRLYEIGKQRVH